MTVPKRGLVALMFFIVYGSVLFLSPLGIPSTSIRFTDLAALTVLVTLALLFLSGMTIQRHRQTAPLLALFVFVGLEIFLPVIGVAVWGDISVGSSTVRAVLYWIPCMLLAFLVIENNLEKVSIYRKLMVIALFANLAVALIELGVFLGHVPQLLNPRTYLAVFALEDSYHYQRIWSAGLFKNSTQLAAFSFILFCHFLSLAGTEKKKTGYLMMAVIAFLLMLLTTSRAPLISSVLVVVLFVFLLKNTFYNLLVKIFIVISGVAALRHIFFSDIELFERYARLTSGINADFSLGKRMNEYWPEALAFYERLGHPTFTNPVAFTGVIDSGYLTYYLQGGVFFVFSLVSVFVFMMLGALYRILIKCHYNYINLMALFLPVYLLVGSVTANPFRNIVVIAFVVLVVIFYSKTGFEKTRRVEA